MGMNVSAITTTPEAAKGFYPTPPALADLLLADIDWHYTLTVLEPSAGKGDLVKAVAQNAQGRNYNQPLNVDCVEIDPYLRSILDYEFGGGREQALMDRREQLREKTAWDSDTRSYGQLSPTEEAEKRNLEQEYDWLHELSAPVVHDDFLTFQSRKRYDLIVMNPPIDLTAGLMCYIQLSLMGCPGYVVIGNTLTEPSLSLDGRGLIPQDKGNVWYTPFYFRDVWHWRRVWAQMGMMFPADNGTETSDSEPETVAQPEPVVYNATKTGQLTLF